MFTGIVETIGTVSELHPHDASPSGGAGCSLTIRDCASILTDAHTGDSISVNGTCLTVTAFDASSFKVGISPETLRRTTLGSLAPGSRLNLERAVEAAGSRMGGHFVQGHVDTVAAIERVAPDGNARTYRLRPRDGRVLRHVVEKGYVTLDGASLTVTRVEPGEGWWEVMLVPYTAERVVMGAKAVGDEVNVEVDVVAKYVESAVEGYLEGLGGGGGGGALRAVVERLVDERMARAGR